MKRFIILFAIIFSGFVFGQETTQKQSNISSETIHEKVDKDAEFPGGLNALRTLFSQKFDVESFFSNSNRVLKTEISFIVEIDGTISDINAIGNNKTFNKEAIKAVSKVKEKWVPALINDEKVRQRFKLPFEMNMVVF